MKLRKIYEQLLFEENNSFTMFTGITQDKWDTIWKNKNLINKPTNVTSNLEFAYDYSYNFETGDYENLVVEIENIPLEAFIAYRKKNYRDDDDFISMKSMDDNKKQMIIDKYELFLVNLFPFKSKIRTTLKKMGE